MIEEPGTAATADGTSQQTANSTWAYAVLIVALTFLAGYVLRARFDGLTPSSRSGSDNSPNDPVARVYWK
jgi:hypothetical protein